MGISWYRSDSRFEPGTVADVGSSVRLVLVHSEHRPHQWRLKLSIRTLKDDGLKDDNLTRPVNVAVFKSCGSLREAQERAEAWFAKWRGEMD